MLYENIFENRYLTVAELNKMGADILVDDNKLRISGVDSLYGCPVEGQELRGFAALVVAGLCALGETTIFGATFIERGYEDICEDISMLGGKIANLEV